MCWPSPKSRSTAPHGFTPVTVMLASCPERGLAGETATVPRLFTPTDTGADAPAPDRSSKASAVIVCHPTPALVHATPYGAVVDDPMRTPSAKKSTRTTTPSESAAVAAIVIGTDCS